MDALNDALAESKPGEVRIDLESLFDAHYGRAARIIARVIRDPGRAEELAVEVFLKWEKSGARSSGAEHWLYCAAARMAVDELRRQERRSRFARLFSINSPKTPEELHASQQEQERVRSVLRSLSRRDAELLILRAEGLRYGELAEALKINPASVGTLLSRAQANFRKEYVEAYGEPIGEQ